MKDLEQMTDEELMLYYQDGDESSFALLFKRHGPRLLSYYQKRVGEPLASDLFQDFFQKLHKVRSLYKTQYPFLPWFFLLARQTLADHFRKKESRLWKAYQIEEFDELSFVDSDGQEKLFDELEHALGFLEGKQREAILNRYLKDWSFSEIAQSLEMSESAVRKMMSRSLQRLRLIMTQKKEEL